MDDFFSDNPFESSELPQGWSERDWFRYLKKSESEISRFAAIYTVNRLRGKNLDDISKLAGWTMPTKESDGEYLEESEAEYADEPWTLLNHPVYIISKGLLKCLQEHLGRIVSETQLAPELVWDISKSLIETSSFMALGANSTDLSEDLLARCNYKMAATKLNEIMAKTSKIPEPASEAGRERIRRINNIIFDLRQLCLNMAEGLNVGKF